MEAVKKLKKLWTMQIELRRDNVEKKVFFFMEIHAFNSKILGTIKSPTTLRQRMTTGILAQAVEKKNTF